jgi:hypothetical protein
MDLANVTKSAGIMFEIVVEFCITHNSLLASFFREKVSKILGLFSLPRENAGLIRHLEQRHHRTQDPWHDALRAVKDLFGAFAPHVPIQLPEQTPL